MGLGTWQLQRKAGKEALLGALTQSQKSAARDLDRGSPSPSLFEPLYAIGHFVPEKTLFLQSKTHHGKNGVYVLDVFQTQKGQFILIQRGWAQREIASTPLGNMKIEGIARVPSAPNYFQPANKSPIYFWIDLKTLSQDFNLPLLPYYLVAKDSSDPRIYPTNPIPIPRNNHLQYAITWYSLAFFLLGMLFWGKKYYWKKETK